jgi:hypothetical protein
MQISINKLTFFTIPFAFPAARMSSMAMGEVEWGGAAVYLTAEAMPGACVRFECHRTQKHGISINKTHLFDILLAFPAARSPL